MPLIRKRRANQADDNEESNARPTGRNTQRRRSANNASTSDDDEAPQNEQNSPDAGAESESSDEEFHDANQDSHNPSTQNRSTKYSAAYQAALQDATRGLVRLALATEHARQPLRRADITAKVLSATSLSNTGANEDEDEQSHSNSQRGPRFRAVFDAAQLELRRVFGMQLVELPARDKVTLAQRRKAQRTQANASSSARGAARGRGRGGAMRGQGRAGNDEAEGIVDEAVEDDDDENPQDAAADEAGVSTQRTRGRPKGTESTSTGSGAYILTSVLPARYRTAAILVPVTTSLDTPSISTSNDAAEEGTSIPPAPLNPTQDPSYTALATFIIALITLAGPNPLPAVRLTRYLRRANADITTPLGGTEKVLARMVKEGYIVRVKEGSSGIGGGGGGAGGIDAEEGVEYIVGPRGKVEVGRAGVEGLVRAVYAGEDGEENADMEKRLEHSLRVALGRPVDTAAPVAAVGGEE